MTGHGTRWPHMQGTSGNTCTQGAPCGLRSDSARHSTRYMRIHHNQDIPVQYAMVLYTTVQFSTVHYSTVQYDTVQQAQYSTAQGLGYRDLRPCVACHASPFAGSSWSRVPRMTSSGMLRRWRWCTDICLQAPKQAQTPWWRVCCHALQGSA
jgi:hypothetical protein